MTAGTVAKKKPYNDIEMAKDFCLGNRLNASSSSEAAVMARARIRWVKFRECREVLYGKHFSLQQKRKVYQSCVQSAVLYGSKT